MATDACPECGMAWTHPDALYRPPTSFLVGCSCRHHLDPGEREKAQHRLGKHTYRAWSVDDANRQIARNEGRSR